MSALGGRCDRTVTMNPWPSRPPPSSTRARCAATSRSSSRRSTASRSPTSTRPRARRSRARCSTAMRKLLRDVVRERPSRRLRACGARDRGARGRARERTRAFLNAPEHREVIFVRNATEAMNLVAYAWGLWNLGPGDLVVVTELEHHSNFVPWQYIARQARRRAPDAAARRARRARPLRASTRSRASGNVKVVATNLVSNSLGTINPIDAARRVGARAGSDLRLRRGAGRAAHEARRAGARRRLRRDLGPQDVRAERRRRALGT